MKYGAINIVTDPGHGLPTDPAPLERQEDSEILRSTIELDDEYAQTTLTDMTIEDGDLKATTIAEGAVLREDLTEIKRRRINEEGDLETVEESEEIKQDETRFIYVEDEILLTQRTEADVARNIIERLCSSSIKEAEIGIQTFAEAHPEAKPVLEWGRDEDGKLCAVDEMSNDSDIREYLDTSQRAQMSFKGLEWNGRSLYGTITKSGYIELYRDEIGGDIGTVEFTRFVLEEVMEHTEISDT